MDADPTDICSMAIYTAIRCTKLPMHTLLKGESGQYEDFEINSNIAESYSLPLVNPVPICLTAYKVVYTIYLLYVIHVSWQYQYTM